MMDLSKLDKLFVGWAFFLQLSLIIHFAVRKPFFESYTMRYGWIIYALSIPAVIISIILMRSGKPWWAWIGGFMFALFSIFGYYADYIRQVPWRTPFFPPIGIPFVILYLTSIMFYWWPLMRINRWLWGVYTVLYVVSMILNIRSH